MKAQAKRKQLLQHLVNFRMAKEVLQYCKSNPTTVIGQFLANLQAENGKGKRGALVFYWNDAIGSMWRNPEVWADAEVEYRSHSDEVKQMMAPLKQWVRGDKQSKFEICDRDEIAGEDESI